MATHISSALRQFVEERANNTCEYCLLNQLFSMYKHEIDHVIAVKHGGKTIADNLVLACLPCNRYKGSDLTSIDPLKGEIVPLFNPRQQDWLAHFQLQGSSIVGMTAIGRTTVFLLRMNDSDRLKLRYSLIAQGVYPIFPDNPGFAG